MNLQSISFIIAGIFILIFANSRSTDKLYSYNLSWALNPFQYYLLMVLSLVLVFGGIYLIREDFLKKKKRKEAMSKLSNVDTKQCPQCAEIIKFEARVCKHCTFKFSEEDILRQKNERERIFQSELNAYNLGTIDDYKLLQIAYDYQYNQYDFGKARYYLEKIKKEFPLSEYLPEVEKRLQEIEK